MVEIWKDIPSYEGLYEASNTGKIRTSENKTSYTKLHGIRHWKQRELKFKSNYNKNFIGYRVTLWKDGKSKDFLVHRLIATTFLENLIDTDMTVNHKDGDRHNNNIDNLEWLTRKENIKYGFTHEQYTKCQIKILLKFENKSIIFDSMRQVERFLNLKKNSLSEKFKKNKTLTLKINDFELIKIGGANE